MKMKALCLEGQEKYGLNKPIIFLLIKVYVQFNLYKINLTLYVIRGIIYVENEGR